MIKIHTMSGIKVGNQAVAIMLPLVDDGAGHGVETDTARNLHRKEVRMAVITTTTVEIDIIGVTSTTTTATLTTIANRDDVTTTVGLLHHWNEIAAIAKALVSTTVNTHLILHLMTIEIGLHSKIPLPTATITAIANSHHTPEHRTDTTTIAIEIGTSILHHTMSPIVNVGRTPAMIVRANNKSSLDTD